jgi:hypothetical protein
VAATTAGLALSDLALASRGHGHPWFPAPGDTALLAPFTAHRRGADLELYYELYGARAGVAYRHEIAVVRLRDGRPELRPAAVLAFDETAAGRVQRARRTLALRRLGSGDYEIAVLVRAPDGTETVRRRAFSIRQ